MQTYYRIWKLFTTFFNRLDYKPVSWEERLTLFVGYLIENKLQTSIIRSYLSAIRGILGNEGVIIEQNSFVLTSLIRASKITNDQLLVRLPIHGSLLKLILKEINKSCDREGQHYQKCLYLLLFSVAYYGLLRIGEVTASPHALTARNVHIALNKKKVLFVLPTSKTHGHGDKPEIIKISAVENAKNNVMHSKNAAQLQRNNFCPFAALQEFLQIRPVSAVSQNEQFFVWRDRTPVLPSQAANMLKFIIKKLGLDESLYSFHGFRSGRAGDLLKLGVSVETIKKIGHWKSNAVFAYLKD